MEINKNIQKQGANGDGMSVCVPVFIRMSINFPIINGFTSSVTLILYCLRKSLPKNFLSISASQFLSL